MINFFIKKLANILIKNFTLKEPILVEILKLNLKYLFLLNIFENNLNLINWLNIIMSGWFGSKINVLNLNRLSTCIIGSDK